MLELDVGEAARIGVRVDTTDVAADVDVALTATIRADAERPAASGVADPGGDLTGAVVSETPTGDQFGSIGAAIDAVTESTVYVEPGTYDENLAIGSPDAGTDPASAPDAGVTVTGIGDGRPTLDGWVQILDPDVTFEGFEVTGEFEGFGVAAFEPGVTIRDVHVRGVTNGVLVPSVPDVRVENCRVESYSFYGALVSGRGRSAGARRRSSTRRSTAPPAAVPSAWASSGPRPRYAGTRRPGTGTRGTTAPGSPTSPARA